MSARTVLVGLAAGGALWLWLRRRRRASQTTEGYPAEEDGTLDCDLAALLTVIITTSPTPAHPSCELILQVIDSLEHCAPELAACRTIVVCDGCNVHPRCKYRSGMVDQDAFERYQEYKQQLRSVLAERVVQRSGSAATATVYLATSSPATTDARPVPIAGSRFAVLELATRHGFGYAVRAALDAVSTPLVCVVQHDRTMMRPVDLTEIAHAVLASDGQVGYVLLPTRATRNYRVQMTSRLGERGVKLGDALEANAWPLPTAARRLLPCLQWYDSTHVASVAFYRKLFAAQPGISGFIESKLGPRMLSDFAQLGIAAALAKWACFLYDDGRDVAIVGHLNGSSARPLAELDAEHAANPGRTGTVGRRWTPSE